jgi:hypothetical protein
MNSINNPDAFRKVWKPFDKNYLAIPPQRRKIYSIGCKAQAPLIIINGNRHQEPRVVRDSINLATGSDLL